MAYRFPGPSARTDRYAVHVDTVLGTLGMGSGFMVSVGELESGRLITAISGSTNAGIEAALETQLLGVPPPRPGFRWSVIEGQSSLHNSMLNPYSGRRYGLTYGGSRNCSEPKIIEMASILREKVVAMTTFWHGPAGNRPYNQGYVRYADNRNPLGGVQAGTIKLAVPCEICRANEARIMLYHEQNFPGRGRPRFGSYESPF